MDGWVSIHRKITQWQWYSDANTARVFIHLLIMANHTDGFYQGYPVKRSQRVTSPDKLAIELGLSRQKVRTALDKLVSTNEITIKATTKFSVITIEKYDFYQQEQKTLTNKTTSKSTNKQPSNNHQITTNNNDNNEKNEKQNKTPLELAIDEFKQFRVTIKKPMSELAVNKLITTLDKLSDSDDEKIEILDQSIVQGWSGVFPLKNKQQSPQSKPQQKHPHAVQPADPIRIERSAKWD
jgi:hypothetical protein